MPADDAAAFRIAPGAVGHDHPHDHGHAHDPRAIHVPGFSLFRLSVAARLAGAGALSALLWVGVLWALA